ncbi:uncharacterized protein [Anoplolepis gracilipes]|uniref:uncharacterized protein isoform X2 n=1 Tax=Anoplolepis gracilipes TaxID=354296 RepID=UPI003BA01329
MMDTENRIKVKFIKKEIKDDTNYHYDTNTAFQENVIQNKEKRKRKKKSTAREIEDSEQLGQVNVKKERIDEDGINDYETDVVFQESIIKEKRKKKRKKNSTEQEIEDSEQLQQVNLKKERIDDDGINDYEADVVFQESIIKEKRKKKKKKNSTAQEIEGSEQLEQVNLKKERINDDGINDYETDLVFQESIVKKKRKKKKKKNSTAKEIEDFEQLEQVNVRKEKISGKDSEKLEQVSNNVPPDIIISKEEPTNLKEELNENAKPKKPSKRQLKKERVIRMALQIKENNKKNAIQKALNYISMWKHSRNEWKFKKLKQRWLMKNLLDENSISDTDFPLVLEYFESCEGMARKVLLRKAMDIIKKAEENNDEKIKNEITKSIAYKRARQLLQILPTDI